MVAKKLYFMDCHLAGRQYHDADEVWDELKVGSVVWLERDLENKHDPYAVAVCYYDQDTDNEKADRYVLGYIPRDENETLAGFLEMGWDNVFECRISKINPDTHPENQVHLTIKIKRNEK